VTLWKDQSPQDPAKLQNAQTIYKNVSIKIEKRKKENNKKKEKEKKGKWIRTFFFTKS
jgi:hypothetical protein